MRKKCYDSASEKQRAYRERKKGSLGSVPIMGQADRPFPANETETVGAGMTETDRLFEVYKPGYYVFGKAVRRVQCHQCHGKFETRMSLLRFCSPECQLEKLASFSTVGLG